MAIKLSWVGCGCAALAAFYACSSPAPSPPRAGGLSGGSTGTSAGGTGGSQLGGAMGLGGGGATGGALGGTGGVSLTGGAGGTGGKASGGASGAASGGAAGAAMGTGGGLPDVPNYSTAGYDSGEQGCSPANGCGGAVSVGAQGTVFRQYWAGIPKPGFVGDSNQVEALTSCLYSPDFPDNPTSSDQMVNGLTSHAPSDPLIPNDYGDYYGERVRGFIKAPVSGNYIFWITADDTAVLFLSTVVPNGATTSVRTMAKAVAAADYPEPPGVFKDQGQKSQAVPMVKDNLYYIDLFHKEGAGGDHWEVRWTRPDRPGTFEKVPADVLYTAVPVPNQAPGRSPNCPPLGTGGASGTGGSSAAAGSGGT